jgi:hypothetical protein
MPLARLAPAGAGSALLDRPAILPPRWASWGAAPAGRGAPRRWIGTLVGWSLAMTVIAVGALLAGAAAASTPVPGADPDVAATSASAVRALAPAAVRPASAVPVFVPAARTAATPSGSDPCPLDWRGDAPDVRSLIVCEAGLWNPPGGAPRAAAVVFCESRFETAAFNPTGCDGFGCSGLFQQSLRYWRDRAVEYGFAGRPATDPRANVVVSMRMAAERGTWARDWPVCGR